MVRRRFCILSLAVIVMLGGRTSFAAPLTLTGNVEADFDSSNPLVQKATISADPTNIGVASWISDSGNVSGWAIKNIWTYYDKTTDTLQVGIETCKNSSGQSAIFGDSDGNGNPGTADSRMTAAGGVDSASFGTGKSFAMAFASANPSAGGVPSIIAGIPLDKTKVGSGIDGFTVSQYKNVNGGLNNNFGTSFGSSAGSLAFDPSASRPHAEFTINNFSAISGINAQNGFWFNAYAGSGNDVIAGEVSTAWIKVPAYAPQETPEPATWLAWSGVVAGGAFYRHRRKRAQSQA